MIGLHRVQDGYGGRVISRRTFPPSRASVSAAREFVSATLSEWSSSGRHPQIEATRLVVSELATNAVVHARTRFDVTVQTDPKLRIVVTDGTRAVPEMRNPLPDALEGRGLYLVDRVCEDWGCDLVADGKSVWVTMPGEG